MSVGPNQRRIEVALTNQQQAHAFDASRLVRAAKSALTDGDIDSAEVSVAVVDDETIRELNRRFLNHDYATDVLSFLLDCNGRHLEGEVIVSADTAAVEAARQGWDIEQELQLYVIHGCLHLIGMDDGDPLSTRAMRSAETKHLGLLGVASPWQQNAGGLGETEGGSTQ